MTSFLGLTSLMGRRNTAPAPSAPATPSASAASSAPATPGAQAAGRPGDAPRPAPIAVLPRRAPAVPDGAQAALDAGRFGDALVQLAHHIDDHGPSLEAHLLQAVARFHLGQFVGARAAIGAIAQLPGADRHPRRGEAAAWRALLHLEDLIDGTPFADPAHPGRAALAEAEATAADHPVTRAARAKARVLSGEGGQALSELRAAASLYPNDVIVRIVQAELMGNLMGSEAARPVAQHLRALAPHSPAARWQLVRSYATDRGLDPALRAELQGHVREMELIAPGAAWGVLASAHLGLPNAYATAPAVPPPAPSEHEDGPMLSMALAQITAMKRASLAGRAQAALAGARTGFPQACEVLAMQAALYHQAGDLDAACVPLAQVRGQSAGPQYLDITLKLAQQFMLQKREAEARTLIDGVLNFAPGNVAACLAKSRLLLAQREPEQAAALAAQAHACGEGAQAAEASMLLGLCEANEARSIEYLRAAFDSPALLAGHRGPVRAALIERYLTRAAQHDKEGKLPQQAELVRAAESAALELLDGTPEAERVEGHPVLLDEDHHRLGRCRASRERVQRQEAGTKAAELARAALKSSDLLGAIRIVEDARKLLRPEHDIAQTVALDGIKAMALLERGLEHKADVLASRALDRARAHQTAVALEAQVVRDLLDVKRKQARKEAISGFFSRMIWTLLPVLGVGWMFALGTTAMRWAMALINRISAGNGAGRGGAVGAVVGAAPVATAPAVPSATGAVGAAGASTSAAAGVAGPTAPVVTPTPPPPPLPPQPASSAQGVDLQGAAS